MNEIDKPINDIEENKVNNQSVDDEQREIILRQTELYSGPIPHPDILKGYEEIEAGNADRIIKLAEKEQEHRIKKEESLIKNNYKLTILGQALSFVIVLAYLLIFGILSYFDKRTEAIGMGLAGLATVIGVFFYRIKHNDTNNDK